MREKLTLDDVRNRLTSLVKEICQVPEDFEVKDEYLNGMVKSDFIEAFRKYRDVISAMYSDAASNLHEYGLASFDSKTGAEKLHNEFSSNLTYLEKLGQIHHFILKLCLSSKMIKDSLDVDVAQLKKLTNTFPKIKSADKLIKKMSDFGFEFFGFTGKLSSTSIMTVSYPNDPNLISVMKSFFESKYSRVGMEFDYAHFNSKLFSVGKNENLKLQDLYVFQHLSGPAQAFLTDFNTAMNEQGYSYGEGATSGYCWGYSQFAYSRMPEKKKDYVCRLYLRGDSLVVRLYLKNINAYASYIENAPAYVKEAFINDFGKCTYCRQICGHRKTYPVNEQEYNKCDGLTFEFYCLSPESIPYYLELIRLSAKAKK